MLRNLGVKVPKRTFFRRKPLVSVKDQIDMFGPTSIRKIEYETFEAGFDIFAQYDDNMPVKKVGEGTKENPFEIPSRNQGRCVGIDPSMEAPGVQGLGYPPNWFWVFENGDGQSGQHTDGRWLTRDPYRGEYYVLRQWEMPEIEIADPLSHGDKYF